MIGPRLRDNAIVLDEVTGAADLPSGWGVDVSLGTGLSDAVAQALPGLVDRVLGELDLDQARRDRLRWAAS
ncbi:hypothetical protein [Kutzneria kofuensis]|uniref:Pantoate kinase n=1 Tax=Kutzneria kofuensis TaxID=103725 RepID=A0A7W9KT27_9PSEU|nr:hypothetical protein [Kutzneria kofuensis]MBB5898062.1 pantoate kinase [Kutzneria kofuensis]